MGWLHPLGTTFAFLRFKGVLGLVFAVFGAMDEKPLKKSRKKDDIYWVTAKRSPE